ncbi:MAG TPA: beta-glucuronidase [Melioribacteraceae bacterium]|nr:beta-glucuronidase [Melioribacteraceae bacterium]
MLYPIVNNYRNTLDLNGIWNFKTDPDKKGEKDKWFKGFNNSVSIAVPGSWNEQLEELGLLHYTGNAWYSKNIFIPPSFKSNRIILRIGSVDYNSKFWIDGKFVGENKIGFLPVELDITGFVSPGKESLLVILVNNELNDESIPQGITSGRFRNEKRLREETNPPTRFDFTPYGGIHRSVQLVSLPEISIDKIRIDTAILNKKTGLISAEVFINSKIDGMVSAEVTYGKKTIKTENRFRGNKSTLKLKIDNCKFWSPENPFLYDIKFKLLRGSDIIDEYLLPVGVREIVINGNKFLLNGKEVYLKGFGKHEDFDVIGKGLFLPLMVKDFELMKWINANSFRTSHYPYSEEMMFYADRKGILVIDEVPAVSLDFRRVNGTTLKTHKEHIQRLIDRDYNHPSIIMWAVGNEPNLVGDQEYYNGSAKKYWKEIFGFTKKLDSSRPVTVPNCTRAGVNDPVFEFSDVISLNRYYGWYEYPGYLEEAVEILGKEMDTIYKKYKRPVLFTEFGVDTMPGFHSISTQMFTEEYQQLFLDAYIKLIRSKEYTIGEHVWNFADFRTPQHFRRVVLNLKGVFTRSREPKSAAFLLKKIWQNPQKNKR